MLKCKNSALWHKITSDDSLPKESHFMVCSLVERDDGMYYTKFPTVVIFRAYHETSPNLGRYFSNTSQYSQNDLPYTHWMEIP